MREEAVKAYAAWLQNYKKRQESRGKKRKVSYDAMSNTNKECIKEAMLASMGMQTNPDDNKFLEKLPESCRNGRWVTCLALLVPPLATPTCQVDGRRIGRPVGK